MTMASLLSPRTGQMLEKESRVLAHNYHPLPVMVARGKGAWVWDIDGRKYLDCLAAYSALNFGHQHPALVRALKRQLRRVALTSRAVHHDQLGLFAEELAALTRTDMVLPMNTGAEAVETALKIARAWGYRVKGVPADRAEIVVATNNFHGRTLGIVSFSTDPSARADFGPFLPGFSAVPFGDAEALEAAIGEHTVAVLLEPIQGEAGIITPPPGYLQKVRALTEEKNILFIADEIQSGLGRTGATLQVDNEGVRPDLITLGKALGGGLLPVSAVVGRADVMGVLRPGEHGSTFGGNPLAAAVGREVVALLATGDIQARAQSLGAVMYSRLQSLTGHGVSDVRGVGLWYGVDIEPGLATGRQIAEAMLRRGVITKDTHGQTLRFAPPLIVREADIHVAVDALESALRSFR